MFMYHSNNHSDWNNRLILFKSRRQFVEVDMLHRHFEFDIAVPSNHTLSMWLERGYICDTPKVEEYKTSILININLYLHF